MSKDNKKKPDEDDTNDTKSSSLAADPADYDMFRDSWIRYLGYSNEIGEAFHPIVPRLLIPSYVVAFGYVGADAVNNVIKAKNNNKSLKQQITCGCDALIWQTFASVLLPGAVVRIITSNGKIICDEWKIMSRVPPRVRFWIPTYLGLCMIPQIIHPIDNSVDYVMNNTLRRLSWWIR
eukprot:gene8031-10882_t